MRAILQPLPIHRIQRLAAWTNRSRPNRQNFTPTPALSPTLINSNGKYNNLPVVNFDGASGNYERFSAKKNGSSNWSALSEDGFGKRNLFPMFHSF